MREEMGAKRAVVIGLFYCMMFFSSVGEYSELFLRSDMSFDDVSAYSMLYALADLLIATVSMMAIPFVCRMINKQRLPFKRGKRLCLWNSILLFATSLVLMICVNVSFIGGVGAIFFYFINKWVFVAPNTDNEKIVTVQNNESDTRAINGFEDYKLSLADASEQDGQKDRVLNTYWDDILLKEDVAQMPETNISMQSFSNEMEQPNTHEVKETSQNIEKINIKDKGKSMKLWWVCVIAVVCIISGTFLGIVVERENVNALQIQYDSLVDEYNALVDEYNVLVDEYNALIETKESYENFETLYFSGTGNGIVKGINAPEGSYYITTTHDGTHNCIAEFYDSSSSYGPLCANFVGDGSAVYGHEGPIKNGYINITADGYWTITIEKAD